jgi:hypothetical protein
MKEIRPRTGADARAEEERKRRKTMMIPKNGVTTHPGEMLLEEFLKPMNCRRPSSPRSSASRLSG